MSLPDYAQSFVPQGAYAITPNDSTDLPTVIRGFEVTVAGDVAVTYTDGTSLVWPDRAPGIVYQGSIKRVLATGTTATGIVGLK